MTQTETVEAVINIRRHSSSRAKIRVGLCALLYFLGFTLSAMAESAPPAEQISKEQQWIEEKKQSRNQLSTTTLSSKQRIAARRYEIRCTKLKGTAALSACNEGLRDFPKNPHLLTGKGDALMALFRYGEALKAYQAALAIDPQDVTIVRKIKLVDLNREQKETSAPARTQPVSEPKTQVTKQLQAEQRKIRLSTVTQKKDVTQGSLTTTKLIPKVENQATPTPPQRTTNLNLTEKPRILFSNAPLPSGFTY